jgi:hypothetical protein
MEINFSQKFKMAKWPETKIDAEISFQYSVYRILSFSTRFLRSFYFAITKLFSKIQNGARIQDGC